MSQINENNKENTQKANNEQYSLNDDRRVKVLSPGALVAKRFFRNRLAVVGMSILIFMFVFSFIGGLISPYGEDEFFYRDDQINKEFAVVTENTDFRYKAKDADKFTGPVQAQTMLAIQKSSETFSYSGTDYTLTPEGKDFYSIASGGAMIGIAYKDVVSPSNEGDALSFEFIYAALKSYAALEQETEGETPDAPAAPVEPTEPAAPAEPAVKTFTVDGVDYVIDEDGSVLQGDTEVAYVSRYIVQAILPDVFLSRDFKEKLIDTIAAGETKFVYTDESLVVDAAVAPVVDGEEGGIGTTDDVLPDDGTAVESSATMEYTIERSQNHANWVIRQQQASRQYDSYQFPSSTHWLGTDRYGMDMLTRLMYGGRVSLMIGFIVIIIETVLGVILGGVAGYFGGWVDNLIMRLVDIFYCIPSMPIILILGAAMDAMRVEPTEPAAPAEPAVKTFTVDGVDYVIDEDGSVLQGDTEVAYVSRYIVQAILPDVFLSRDFKEKLIDTIAAGETKFVYTDESLVVDAAVAPVVDGEEGGIGTTDDVLPDDGTAVESSATMEYTIERSQNHANWVIRQQQASRQYDSYQFPSSTHWLGTDRYGMDMLTRLMYGGRVSLMIGFIVIIIETVLGVILGGVAGYFGGWVDNLIMRLVDIFYCIPSMPIILILGAAMDAMRVEPGRRLIYLMLILGILGWAGIARLVRGQILSLREQEFMTATEACGISVKSRIFKHLIPNVIPQLIVNCTMGLGSVIIMEATLSFLGLGVKFPFASWGNIINDVNNTHTLTTYWFIWIPAGMLLLLTVLAFNLVGDGLRDAFDPKMKR